MKNRKQKPDPYEEIHTDYSTKQREFKLLVPSNFRMLCALLETEPEKILTDFLWFVSHDNTEASGKQRSAAVEYFIINGYGQKIYDEKDIREMFKELEAIRCLSPEINDKDISWDQLTRHYSWNHMYIQYWFKKWFYKVRRKGKLSDIKNY